MKDVCGSVLVVFANAVAGRLEEFRLFYDRVHIPEIVDRYPEILSAERHDFASAPSGESGGGRRPDSVAVYVVKGDAAVLWRQLKADQTVSRSEAFDYTATRAVSRVL